MSIFGDGRHPMSGKMDRSTPWQIREALLATPPTKEQLDELAAEELLGVGKTPGRDRSEVYRIFAKIVTVEP